jgi:hypothetical protein
MILPTKCLKPDMALLTIGADILDQLQEPRSVFEVWERMRADRHKITPARPLSFDWFVLALDLLYAISAIDFSDGRLRRGARSCH